MVTTAPKDPRRRPSSSVDRLMRIVCEEADRRSKYRQAFMVCSLARMRVLKPYGTLETRYVS
jgi:hypothetical protein